MTISLPLIYRDVWSIMVYHGFEIQFAMVIYWKTVVANPVVTRRGPSAHPDKIILFVTIRDREMECH